MITELDIASIASGTIAKLIGNSHYKVIMDVQTQFLLYVKEHPSDWETWQDAWHEFDDFRFLLEKVKHQDVHEVIGGLRTLRKVKQGEIKPAFAGHFLKAVIDNDLLEACKRADLCSRRNLWVYAVYLSQNLPSNS